MTKEVKQEIIKLIDNIEDMKVLNFIYLYLKKINNGLGE